MALKNAFGQLALEHASANGDAHYVSGTKQRYRREFTDPTLAAWDVVTGPGMAVAVANSNLTITTGTTANSVTTLTSKDMFRIPFKAAFGLHVSQKIANQEMYVELVACDENTGVVDETEVAAWRISGTDSTTTTIARVESRNGQAARLQSANITVATQTTQAIYEIVLESDEIQFHNKPADSTGGKTASQTRNTVAPDPNGWYKLRYRIVNAAVAPASTTTVTSSFCTAVDYSEILVEVTGGQGSTSASGAIAVVGAGGSISVSSAAIGASSGVTGTTVAKVNSAATTNATAVKTSAARLYGYQLANTSASWRYLKLYNQTTAPTPGAAPAMVVPLPPGSSVHVDRSAPVAFSVGLGYTITAGPLDTDVAAVGAQEIVGHLLYA